MAENSLKGEVIGVAFDGTGYGEDGAIWGGEFLLTTQQNFRRVGHLKYVPLPGGDAAIRKPARTALAYLWASDIEWDLEFLPVAALCAEERLILKSQLTKNINTPLASSMGRLFDAVASLAGVQHVVNYEAQAAIEFEAMADPTETGEYDLPIVSVEANMSTSCLIDPSAMIGEILEDVHNGIAKRIISARFHNSIATVVSNMCAKIRQDVGVNDVFLSGGVWQNLTLLQKSYDRLTEDRFTVFTHKLVPTNDGGIALGQAILAIHRLDN
jgi:hydrogenase maturation protein HypF